MNLATIVDRAFTLVADVGSSVAATAAHLFQAGHDVVSRVPEQHQAIAALVAAASIMVTLVTMYLWPSDSVQPTRDTMDAAGVRRMARQGLTTAEIARRTGLAHDAVATIIRAGTLTRSNAIVAERKSRPSAARSAGWLRLTGLRK
jgi:hypothetical protein